MSLRLFTSESVTEGHPDKVCDLIADAILDANIGPDPYARVACEVLCKGKRVVLAGEITSKSGLKRAHYEEVVREAIDGIGYVDPADAFHAKGVLVTNLLTRQSKEIGKAVSRATDAKKKDLGAGDQGIMFGYATDIGFASPIAYDTWISARRAMPCFTTCRAAQRQK